MSLIKVTAADLLAPPRDATVIMQRSETRITGIPSAPQAQNSPTATRKSMDPTDPGQIVAIATRSVRIYIFNNGTFFACPKQRGLAHAKALKTQGKPIKARLEQKSDGEVLTFG